MTLISALALWLSTLVSTGADPCADQPTVEQSEAQARDAQVGSSSARSARSACEGDDDDDIYNGF